MEIEMEKTDEEYEREFEKYEREFEEIERMFPDAKFTISIDIEELDDLITDKQSIIIKHVYDCYCYENCNKKTEYFCVRGEKLTQRYVIEQLIKKGLEIECNHIFLEGFHKTKGSECQFELIFGS